MEPGFFSLMEAMGRAMIIGASRDFQDVSSVCDAWLTHLLSTGNSSVIGSVW